MMKLRSIFSLLMASAVSLSANSTTVVFPNGNGGYGVITVEQAVEEVSCELRPIPATAVIQDEGGDARLLVTSDIGGSDPDDIQSHIHLLTFIDYFDFEGIITGPPHANHSNGNTHIRLNIDAYESDLSKLKNVTGADSDDFPAADELRGMIYQGASSNRAPEKNSGDTEGSNKIIERARCGYHEGDTRPLYVTAWGSKTDIAKALMDAPDIARVIGIVSYGSHNSSGYGGTGGYGKAEHDWIRRNHPKLYLVDYFGNTKPMTYCGDGLNLSKTFNELTAYSNSKLSQRLKKVPNKDYLFCRKGTNNSNGTFLKMGDSITIAFLLNRAASQRNNPSTAYWGRYDHVSNSYWKLRDERFNRLGEFVTKWKNRFSAIHN